VETSEGGFMKFTNQQIITIVISSLIIVIAIFSLGELIYRTRVPPQPQMISGPGLRRL
jgi:hypothetical protein